MHSIAYICIFFHSKLLTKNNRNSNKVMSITYALEFNRKPAYLLSLINLLKESHKVVRILNWILSHENPNCEISYQNIIHELCLLLKMIIGSFKVIFLGMSILISNLSNRISSSRNWKFFTMYLSYWDNESMMSILALLSLC